MWRPLKWLLADRAGCLIVLCVGIFATAFITFVIAPAHLDDRDSFLSPKDGPVYRWMAESAVAGNEFRDPNGEPSHKMSPVFPLFMAAFMLVLGTGDTTARIASFASYLVAVYVLRLTTGDLFGRRAGLLVSAVYAIFPLVMKVTATYASDNLIVATFALTLWAVLRATREPRMMILAGIFAGLLSLLRASFLPFLVVGAVCGLGWRLQHRGWRALADPFYLSGGAIFVSMNLAWVARNLLYFGDPRGDPYFYIAVEQLAAAPAHRSVGALAVEAAIAVAVFGLLAACFRREIAFSLGPLRSLLPWNRAEAGTRASRSLAEWVTGLWLAFFLSASFLVLASASFLNLEVLYYGDARVATAGDMLYRLAINGYWRYYLPAAVPLAWLGLMFAPPRLAGEGRATAVVRAALASRPRQSGGPASAGRPRRVPEAV